ncbi:FAS1-like dehydratase domain-containing protein [Halomonas sp. AOP13-D3-9]|uniref:FAS1-like dehydratase domain-containing protein n=1 Tax=Halomonas sp. AOP42-B2-16 TaxID=3457673 RepID=UPI004033DFA7
MSTEKYDPVLRFNSRWLTLEGHEFPLFQARIKRERMLRYLEFLGRPGHETEKNIVCEDIGSVLPTFPFSLEMEAGVVNVVARLLEVDANCLLHAEQAFTYYGPLRCEDLVTVESWLQDVTWKPGSRVCFFGKESRFLVDGRLTVSSRSVYAIKAIKGGKDDGAE